MKKITIIFVLVFLLSSCDLIKNEKIEILNKKNDSQKLTDIRDNKVITKTGALDKSNEQEEMTKDSKEKLKEIIDNNEKNNEKLKDTANKTIDELTKDFDEDLDETIEDILGTSD